MNTPLQRLDELARLPNNWDSYGAKTITGAAIDEARRLIRLCEEPCQPPAIVPTNGGGVQLEWVHPHGLGSDVEIEIGPDGRIIGLWVML